MSRIDAIITKRLLVNGEALAGSNVIVPQSQLQPVVDALTRGGVKLWVDDHPISVRNFPPFIRIKWCRMSNTPAVQQMLDEI